MKLIRLAALIAAVIFPALSLPAGVTAQAYLKALPDRNDFARLQAPSFIAYAEGLPSVMIVLDRAEKQIYFLNSSSYALHTDFIEAQYLSSETGAAFIRNQLDIETRRFLLGFLTERGDCLSLELWRDDVVTPGMLSELHSAVKKSLFSGCLGFTPASGAQEEAAREAGIKLLSAPAVKQDAYQMISEGVSYGLLRISTGTGASSPTAGLIPVLKEPPDTLSSAIAGFVTSEVASALSHACILARTLNIPAFYMPEADKTLAAFDGVEVRLEVRRTTYSVSAAAPGKAAEFLRTRATAKKRPLHYDLEWRELTPLGSQFAADVPRFGAKSSNLGQVANFSLPGFKVPPGFTIPFFYYGQFLRENGLAAIVSELLNSPETYTDPEKRKERLAALRARIQAGKMNAAFAGAVRRELAASFPDKGVFVRSSTNSEDIPGFSGAGLYTTVPNVKGPEKVLEAVKTVWASIWNDRAFDAREIAGLDHFTAMPAVLVQEAMEAEISGVMFTRSDLPGKHSGCVEIGAKRGLGMRIVEGHASPERLFYCAGGVLHRAGYSRDGTMISFAPGGGVRESTAPTGVELLGPVMAEKLALAGLEIEKRFNGVPQDIEWLVSRGVLYIVQSRPYAFNGAGKMNE